MVLKTPPTRSTSNQAPEIHARKLVRIMPHPVLERASHAEHSDHRNYQYQSIDLIPTVHLGAATSQR